MAETEFHKLLTCIGSEIEAIGIFEDDYLKEDFKNPLCKEQILIGELIISFTNEKSFHFAMSSDSSIHIYPLTWSWNELQSLSDSPAFRDYVGRRLTGISAFRYPAFNINTGYGFRFGELAFTFDWRNEGVRDDQIEPATVRYGVTPVKGWVLVDCS